MYAVIRNGGKQYRVTPGDVLRLEKIDTEAESVELGPVLAVVGDDGLQVAPAGARVRAAVLGQDNARKILVFHYKRKKQYKKLAGHRQPFTEVRIASIEVDGRQYTA